MAKQDTWITTGFTIGNYRNRDYYPKEMIGTRFVKFAKRKHKITHVVGPIVQVYGLGFGRIEKVWDKHRDASGHMRGYCAIKVVSYEKATEVGYDENRSNQAHNEEEQCPFLSGVCLL